MVSKRIPSLLIIIFSFLAIDSFSQIGWDSTAIQSKDKLFFGLTYNILPGIEKGPVNTFPYYIAYPGSYPPYPPDGFSALFLFNTDFGSVGGKVRYNLVEFSSRTSLSLSTSPSVGVGLTIVDEQDIHQITPYADASYNVPLVLEFNYGNNATRNTIDNYGLFAFAGIEYTGLLLQNNAVNGTVMDMNGNYYTANFINHWTEAVFGIGLRYRNRRNIQREVFIKYGVGPEQLYVSPYEIVQTGHPWTLKLSFVRDF
jgi:hypothetical protein